MEAPLTAYLRHRDVLLPGLEDSTVAETGDPRQGRPRGRPFVESGPWEAVGENHERGSPLESRLLPASPSPGAPLECPVTRLIFRGVSFVDLVVEPHVGHGHAVLGEGARLVRADGGGGAQRLHRLQVLHQAVLPRHALGGQGQTHLGERGGGKKG